MSWEGLSQWWLEEVSDDPAYEEVVTPLVLSLLGDIDGATLLDVGCGEGRIMAAVTGGGATVIGLDLDARLLALAASQGPVLRAELPRLDPVADRSVDAAYLCLVLEHLEDHHTMFDEAFRVVKPGGKLVLVINHPIFTAPDSAPIHDDDGETLWRPGEYFSSGWTDEPAGGGSIRFHHRTLADLLTSAAQAGWSLEELVELGVSEGQVQRTPWLDDQRHIPRLLGCRWINASGR